MMLSPLIKANSAVSFQVHQDFSDFGILKTLEQGDRKTVLKPNAAAVALHLASSHGGIVGMSGNFAKSSAFRRNDSGYLFGLVFSSGSVERHA